MGDFLNDFDAFSNSWWPYIITFCVSVISAIRIYCGGTQCPSQSRIDGKTVIVTGGSSGIGLETAKELAMRGGNIILAIRNAEKGKIAVETIKKLVPNANVTIKIVDMSEFSSIKNFVEQIVNELDQLDILINNAGIAFEPYKKTIEGNEITFATNYLGPFLFTNLLLPLLDKSENGRVINVSALAHFNAELQIDQINSEKYFNEREAFAQSKLALTVITKHMAALYKKTKITFNCVSPGLVRGTGHFKNSNLQKSFWTKMSVWPWMWLFLKTPKQGCQSVVYVAVEPTLNNVTGCYFSDCEVKEPSEIVNDVKLAQELYEKSCKFVDINPEKQFLKIKENRNLDETVEDQITKHDF